MTRDAVGPGLVGILSVSVMVQLLWRIARRRLIRERILQMNDDFIAGAHSKIRRLAAFRIGVAVASRAIGLPGIPRRQGHFEHATPAAQIRGLFDRAAGLGARTRVLS